MPRENHVEVARDGVVDRCHDKDGELVAHPCVDEHCCHHATVSRFPPQTAETIQGLRWSKVGHVHIVKVRACLSAEHTRLATHCYASSATPGTENRKSKGKMKRFPFALPNNGAKQANEG